MRDPAYCGLECGSCPAYLATVSGYGHSRKRIAEEWSRIYGRKISPEEISCTGCRKKEGLHFSHCYECSIRLCAVSRGVETCASCGEYPCLDLEEFFELAPEARNNLEALRRH
ncbi:MAG: hypothetical protein AVO35_00835 [Candidatus Aegiribacteria sp. MLS_C]|nr:MAG: hypothetical protein AVO35_00835 [Candidatus Aegiribacteria sp. MLS_C]